MTKKHNITLTAVEMLSTATLSQIAGNKDLSAVVFERLRQDLGEQITTLIKDIPLGDLVSIETTDYGKKYTLKVEVISGLNYEGCVNNIRQSGR